MSSTEWQDLLAMQVTQGRNHIQGPAAAPVTLFQSGDFECLYSGAAYPIVNEVQLETFYINGVRHDDSYEIETLLAALERAAAPERERG